MNLQFENRRKEPRQPASGEIVLSFEDPLPLEVRGIMLDTSQSGFRVTHQFREMRPGQVVRFRNCRLEGEARVMWNRILCDNVESGFLILA
jgi:hypothetical protein